jgi:hypothetical protein
MTDEKGRAGKKKYARPELKKVLLRPEEAVLGACKNSAAHGPMQIRCNSPAPCNVMGS